MKKKSLFESKNTIVRVLVAFVRDIYDNQNLKKKIFLSPYFSQMKSCSLMLFRSIPAIKDRKSLTVCLDWWYRMK
jgi:hypothetical protein